MKNILVPVDFTASTPAILEAAEGAARGAHARILLLHVIRPPIVASADAEAVRGTLICNHDEAARKLGECGRRLAGDGIETETITRFGPAADCILEEARRTHPECIVIGSHGHTAIYELFIGSTTAAVLKRAPCPVLVVPPGRSRPPVPAKP